MTTTITIMDDNDGDEDYEGPSGDESEAWRQAWCSCCKALAGIQGRSNSVARTQLNCKEKILPRLRLLTGLFLIRLPPQRSPRSFRHLQGDHHDRIAR